MSLVHHLRTEEGTLQIMMKESSAKGLLRGAARANKTQIHFGNLKRLEPSRPRN